MQTVFDEYLNKEVEVHDEVTPNIGKNLKIEDPDIFKQIFEKAQKEESES